MKQTNAFVKGIAALLCAVIILGMGALPAKADSSAIKSISVSFDTPFQPGYEIPYTYTYTTEPTVYSLGVNNAHQGGNCRNGVAWWDWTENRLLKPNQSNLFQEGHLYGVSIYLNTDLYYTQNFGPCDNVVTRVKLNGYEATVETEIEFDGIAVEIHAWYQFTAIGEIRHVLLPSIPTVTVGETPVFRKSGTEYDSEDCWHIDYSRRDMGSEWLGAERWYDETTGKYIDDWDVFQKGHTYRYSVVISANGSGVFRTQSDGLRPDVRVKTADGIEASDVGFVYSTYDENGLHDIIASFTVPAFETISDIRVTGITEPATGAYPDYTVTESAEGYHIQAYNGENWQNGVLWQDKTAEFDLTPESVFQAGHTYRCIVAVAVDHSGYEFANNGTDPTVSGYMDGESAQIYPTGSDMRHNLGLYRDYRIPAPNETIGSVAVSGVAVPAPGAKPSYSAKVSTDANCRVSSESAGNIRNGVLWYDATEQRYLTPDQDVFIAGHRYRVFIDLVTGNGYEFATQSNGRFNVTATLNGEPADVQDTGDKELLTVTQAFSCGQSDRIYEVSVYGLTKPAPGEKPSYGVKVSPDANYSVSNVSTAKTRNGVLWYDATGQYYLTPEQDTFIAGHVYRVFVDLMTGNGYAFATLSDGHFDVRAALNGEAADVQDTGDEELLTVTQAFSCVRLPGDADLDGKVDMRDALIVVQFVRGMFPLINMVNADVNGDGKVDMQDALLIGQFAAGWNVGLK